MDERDWELLVDLEGEPLVREAGGEVGARRPVQVHLVRSPQGGLVSSGWCRIQVSTPL